MKISCTRLLLVVLVLLTAPVCAQKRPPAEPSPEKAKSPPKVSEKTVRLTYVGNEGVLIEAEGKRVLIDGLHRFYKEAYLHPPDELLQKLERAQPPYAKIDLLLVSHLHRDHFHPRSVWLRLLNDPDALLVTSPQVVAELEPTSGEVTGMSARIRKMDLVWKESKEEEFGGVRVRFLGLRHANANFRWVRNLGHLIKIGGKKLLHIGDADMTDENFAVHRLAEEKIDAAFIPYWFLLSEEGRELVAEQFAPRRIIAVHVPPSEASEIAERLSEHYPDITVFTEMLETKEL